MIELTPAQLNAILTAQPLTETLFVAVSGANNGQTEYLAYDASTGNTRHIVVRGDQADTVATMIPARPVPNTIHARAIARGQAIIESAGSGAPDEALKDVLTDLMHWAIEIEDTTFEDAMQSASINLSAELVDAGVD